MPTLDRPFSLSVSLVATTAGMGADGARVVGGRRLVRENTMNFAFK